MVQNDVGNEHAPTTIVVPFTTAFDDELYPFEVLVRAENGPLREDSVVVCSQLRTVAIEEQIGENLEAIPEDRMAAVDEALEDSLGLRPV